MLKKFIISNSERFLSRWVVLIFDLFLVIFAYQSAVLLRFNLEPSAIPEQLLLEKLPLILGAYLIGFLFSRSHVGVIRHTSLVDTYAIFKAGAIGAAIVTAFSGYSQFTGLASTWLRLPFSIVFIHFLLNLFLMITSRLMIKLIFHTFRARNSARKKVLVYGAGTLGLITKNTLQDDTSSRFEIVGFIDDNPSKVGKSLEGIRIFSPGKALQADFLNRNKISQVIIAIQSGMAPERRAEIVEECLKYDLRVKEVPAVDNWIHGELSAKQIKNIRIEDLLERETIKLDTSNISRELRGKVVLVTGAAGSIGSEIARQCIRYKPSKLVLLDQAESAMYELDYELKEMGSNDYACIKCIIGDVRDQDRMERVFEVCRPEVVFHAAAYKHVPLMESNPYEAVGVNIFGTKIIADKAAEFGVDKFVLVSTDKAVNPTNVMGATKRTAELYTQSLGNRPGCKTQFITTRFGNVLGSNGSVIPIFRKQINSGGPITITHRDITRYFMTIPEACSLVLEAGAMGQGGEIYVFDMGRSVKIYDLARKMIKLSGLQLGKDIEIKEIGLRPGEKLFEELLTQKENTQATYHPKIMIAKTARLDYSHLEIALADLEDCKRRYDNYRLVRGIKEIVPEFKSNNSEFASLDLKKSS